MEHLILASLLCFWFVLLGFPRTYLTVLFFVAPLHGLFVRVGLDLDFFKAGLLVSPLLALHGITWRPLRFIARPLLLLATCAGLLFAWQFLSQEITEYDILRQFDVDQRMAISLLLWLSRLFLVVLIASLARGLADVERWVGSYVAGVVLVCGYGLLQEGSFLLTGDPITGIVRDGLLGTSQDFSTVEFGGLQLLRVHSLSREPKDLALFCCPVIGWLISRMFIQRRTLKTYALACTVVLSAFLTFSSSLIMIFPAILVCAIPKIRRRYSWVLLATIVLASAPLFWRIAEVRVFERFLKGVDLLQESRERPALQFVQDHVPRSLLGYGVGSQAFLLPAYMPVYYRQVTYETSSLSGVDSLAVGLLVDLGVPGALLMLLIAMKVLRSPELKTSRGLPLRAALWGSLVAAIPLNPDLRNAVLWLFLGVACALWFQERQSARRAGAWVFQRVAAEASAGRASSS